MAKYIVTGGAGFIGSTLADRLIKEKNEIIIIDNLHSGSIKNINKKALFHEEGVEEVNYNNFKDIDGIFHLGIYSSSPMYKEQSNLVSYALNGYTKILEYAKEKNIPIVFASTSSLYSGQIPPHKEDMETVITDYYSEARYYMERMSKLYTKLYNANIIGLRLFSVYGKKEKYKGEYANLVSQFMWNLKDNKSPLVYGNGTQTRDFTYVDDAVEAFILSMKCLENKKGYWETINIGTGESFAINDMVDILRTKLETNIKTEYLNPNPIKNYVQDTLADTNKAEKIINFKAKYNLLEGIDKLIGRI